MTSYCCWDSNFVWWLLWAFFTVCWEFLRAVCSTDKLPICSNSTLPYRQIKETVDIIPEKKSFFFKPRAIYINCAQYFNASISLNTQLPTFTQFFLKSFLFKLYNILITRIRKIFPKLRPLLLASAARLSPRRAPVPKECGHSKTHWELLHENWDTRRAGYGRACFWLVERQLQTKQRILIG